MSELNKQIYQYNIDEAIADLQYSNIEQIANENIILLIGSKEDFTLNTLNENFNEIITKKDELFLNDFAIERKNINNKDFYTLNYSKNNLTSQELKKVTTSIANNIPSNSNYSIGIILGESFLNKLPKYETFIISLLNDLPFKDNRFKKDFNNFKPCFKTITFSFLNNQANTNNINLEEIKTIYKNIIFTRLVANTPSNIATPYFFSKEAEHIANSLQTKITIFDKEALESNNFNAYLAVAKGSKNLPYMSVLSYQGNPDSKKNIALVGKGLTFDSGGLCIKPPANMDEMIFDKCGAAAVLGVFKTSVELKLPINLTAIIACAENMPDANAYKPGDILKSRNGLTIEVLNTDAEGRLVLCDAIDYATELQPTVIIDVATLTGACCIALGKTYSGLFSNNENLTNNLLEASKKSSDLAWSMPIGQAYKDNITPNFGDISNTGPRYGGASHAAQFLECFVKDIPWAHLDIAATAWNSDAKKGATARPLALLIEYLKNAN